ncbi:uncharacterized protein LOC143033459 [Oratosquilla oratoria]|uniref:uncharacterized protein LOC143033459 n=1 Tax=Oratosquilla oratoria TaxID=337810 RepID=UPI003F760613
MWCDELKYEAFNEFRGGAEKCDWAVRCWNCWVFIGFWGGDYFPMLPDVGPVLVRDKRTVRDVKSIPSASLDFDHRLVICKLSGLRPKKMQRAIRNRIKVEEFIEQNAIDGFQMLVVEGLQTIALTDIHQAWSELKINGIAENTLGNSQTGVTKKKLTIWWNEEVKNAVRDKKKTYRQWMKCRSEATRNIYVAARNKAEQI